jgi:RNA polymerase sigma-70 factor (ECF subfamily)
MPGESEFVAEARRSWHGFPIDPWLEDLSRTYGPDLYRFLLRATPGDRQLAGELTRETLRRAWQILQPLGPDVDDVGAWLFTIARRVAIDHVREWRNRPGWVGIEESTSERDPVPALDILADGHGVRMGLGRLGADQRRVVVEIYGHGRSVAEAAIALGMSAAMVRRRAYDALRAVRASIDGGTSGQPVVA